MDRLLQTAPHFHFQSSSVLPLEMGLTGFLKTSCNSILNVLVLYPWRWDGEEVPKSPALPSVMF